MSTREELEALSSGELHDRAVGLAKHRLDVGFMRRVMRAIPAAEAAIGDVDEAEMDVADSFNVLAEFKHAGEGELGDALRPMFVDYLLEHEK